MKNMFESGRAQEMKQRIAQLKADSARQWGTMKPAQALEHCSRGVETALGDKKPPRVFVGRLLGWIVKPKLMGNDEPLRRNTPTARVLVVKDERDLETERARLVGLIDRLAAAGPAGCTTHPHAFFGPLTPDEWAILMYKHLDHHLRQFGV
jgi:Protein of unknown function (DUF1569)